MDQPGLARPDEVLDENRLLSYLRSELGIAADAVHARQFPSGYSNLTYLITAGDRELVLRRPPFGTKAATAHDVTREFRLLQALHPHFAYCPQPVAHCDDETVLGAPFFLMERIAGLILRKDLPGALRLLTGDARRLSERLIDTLVELHSLDVDATGLGVLGKPQGYAQRQVQGWSERYRTARTPDAPACERVMSWLAEHIPPDPRQPCLVHNDFRFDNIVLDPAAPTSVIGVLDWELAAVGDPLMDLGNSLAYWVQADDPAEMQAIRLAPTHVGGMLTRAEVLDRYCRGRGIGEVDFRFYRCFGLFRLAVIAQQIYYRFFHSQTTDVRFKALVHAVAILDRAAEQVLAPGHC
ncbi:MAG: phosphotransferase family protein [Candidatus Schekmanbacteria bacterium]|nr:phosphotransferase family protein [Candidatus Schekmanbacteria bacterium]